MSDLSECKESIVVRDFTFRVQTKGIVAIENSPFG
jgi:hypothetical protein